MASCWKIERTKDPMVYILRYVFLLLFFVRHIFKMAIVVFHERLIWVLLLLHVLSFLLYSTPAFCFLSLCKHVYKSFSRRILKLGLNGVLLMSSCFFRGKRTISTRCWKTKFAFISNLNLFRFVPV